MAILAILYHLIWKIATYSHLAVLGLSETLFKACKEDPVDEDDYQFFSEEQLEELLKKKTEEKNDEQENNG